MNDWTAGYVADIDYGYGYYKELNPLRLRLAFLNAGLVFPAVEDACELGFGQGLSVNLHAAASPVRWYGNDFNPAQASFARELARVAGSGAELTEQPFAEFCARADLPEFDFICLHGIWSWVSDVNRDIIVDFIARKLKVGGVAFLSYNAQPGWAAMVPVRELMLRHSELLGTAGHGIVARIDGALGFVERLMATKPAFVRNNPQIPNKLKQIRGHERSYLAHEYFNRDWAPMTVASAAELLRRAKLEFACSTSSLAPLDAVNLTDEQQAFLAELPDPLLRELVYDFMVHRQFRCDYWVKGARRLTALEQAEALREQRVVLVQPRADVSLKIHGQLGEGMIEGEAYAPVLDALADHRARTIGQLEQIGRERGLDFAAVVAATLALAGIGAVAPAQDEAAVERARPRTAAINQFLARKARSSNDFHFLASPVTGGGIAVDRLHQLFLLARARGEEGPRGWAADAWRFFEMHGQRLKKDGRELETAEANLAELGERAWRFAERHVPLLEALQVG